MANILIIKHGSFGDIIKATGAFRAIKNHHENDNITLLTTSTFKNFCKKMGFFNDIMIDPRTKSLLHYFNIINQIKDKNFDIVYDLQCSKRTNIYFKILSLFDKMNWAGTSTGCAFHISTFDKKNMHPYKFFAAHLINAGINLKTDTLEPELSWLQNKSNVVLPNKFVLMIPGSSTKNSEKRWPADFYGEIAKRLDSFDISSVIIGGKNEKHIAKSIYRVCPKIIDITGKTKLEEILHIAKQSTIIIGNDTGPTFLASAANKPMIIPWSSHSKAHLHAPLGDNIKWIEEHYLGNLNPDRIWQEMQPYL